MQEDRRGARGRDSLRVRTGKGNDLPRFTAAGRGRAVIPRPIILVVDDEPDNLDLIERVLGFDYEIHRAPNGEEALRVLRQVPDVAVIITDQKMPGLTGTEFLKKASVHQPEAVQMIVTGFVGTQELIEAINSTNVYRFMAKPWDVDEMIAVVQRAARL
ncbi:MAG: hypothetical protein DMG07_26050, partial [Acidobacteria bacterium]